MIQHQHNILNFGLVVLNKYFLGKLNSIYYYIQLSKYQGYRNILEDIMTEEKVLEPQVQKTVAPKKSRNQGRRKR